MNVAASGPSALLSNSQLRAEQDMLFPPQPVTHLRAPAPKPPGMTQKGLTLRKTETNLRATAGQLRQSMHVGGTNSRLGSRDERASSRNSARRAEIGQFERMFFQAGKPAIGSDKASQLVDLRGFDATNAYTDMVAKEEGSSNQLFHSAKKSIKGHSDFVPFDATRSPLKG